MSTYGRQDDEWDVLVRAGKQFLRERAVLKRDTSYTEMSVTLARRTGYPPFDFSEQAERTAMGYLLGRIVQETYPTVGAMMSALVIYLDANDAGSGFYQLAQDMGLLPKNASKDAKDEFWVRQTKKTFEYFDAGGKLELD